MSKLPKWLDLYLKGAWYTPYLPMSHPDSYYHDVYQKRIDRIIIIVEAFILLCISYSGINVPDSIEYPIPYKLMTMCRYFLVGVSVAGAVGAIIFVIYHIVEWARVEYIRK